MADRADAEARQLVPAAPSLLMSVASAGAPDPLWSRAAAGSLAGSKARYEMSTMRISHLSDLRASVSKWRHRHEKIAVVPTMGALHEGHLSLVRAALARAPRVIVTLFVNPRQFDNADDLAAYPRSQEEDAAKLEGLGADLLYAPDLSEVYPPGFATTVSVGGVSQDLCGARRPGHFNGVATVVTKLLLQTRADLAFFGEKDFQQLLIVRRLVKDLDLPVEIVGCPTIREADGLAISSRNRHLSLQERGIAPKLAAILSQSAERLAAGQAAAPLLQQAKETLLAAGFRDVEYLELRAEDDLSPLERAERPARLFAAAWLGRTRLIDNMPVGEEVCCCV